MTIAIAMKINDGIILATDSSSTILGKNENGDDEVHHSAAAFGLFCRTT